MPAGLGKGVHQRLSVAPRHRVRHVGCGRAEPVSAAAEEFNSAVGVLRGQVRRGPSVG